MLWVDKITAFVQKPKINAVYRYTIEGAIWVTMKLGRFLMI